MTTHELIQSLQQQGVIFFVTPDLKWIDLEGPEHLITPEIVTFLRDHKAQAIECLAGDRIFSCSARESFASRTFRNPEPIPEFLRGKQPITTASTISALSKEERLQHAGNVGRLRRDGVSMDEAVRISLQRLERAAGQANPSERAAA